MVSLFAVSLSRSVDLAHYKPTKYHTTGDKITIFSRKNTKTAQTFFSEMHTNFTLGLKQTHFLKNSSCVLDWWWVCKNVLDCMQFKCLIFVTLNYISLKTFDSSFVLDLLKLDITKNLGYYAPHQLTVY